MKCDAQTDTAGDEILVMLLPELDTAWKSFAHERSMSFDKSEVDHKLSHEGVSHICLTYSVTRGNGTADAIAAFILQNQ